VCEPSDRLGTAVVLACVVASQTVGSVVLDQLAVLGLEKREASWGRILGAVLMTAGAFLIGVVS
jgi:bacterial/archaeal transporter family-2 protein